MEEFGIYSRNIVLFDRDLPVCGVILVSGETIADIIEFEPESSFSEIQA
jgi:hypothetical protein